MHHISVVFLHLQMIQRIWAIARRWVVRQWVPDHAIKIHQMIKHQTLCHLIFKQPKETVHLWKVCLLERSYLWKVAYDLASRYTRTRHDPKFMNPGVPRIVVIPRITQPACKSIGGSFVLGWHKIFKWLINQHSNQMEVSWNGGTPQVIYLKWGFSSIKHPAMGVPSEKLT